MAYKHIEKPVMKKDAMNLLLGKPVYVDDITSQDCLVVKVLRSPHAHALIEEIDVSKAQKIPGIEAVYTRCSSKTFYHGRSNVSRTKSL